MSAIPRSMTVEEFLAWCPEDGQRWQLVDGEPLAMPCRRIGHGALTAEVGALLRNHLWERQGPATVVIGVGIVPHVRAGLNLRVPDIAATFALCAGDDAHLRDPVLLIEILSSGYERASWANVWTYTTIPSVRDILVLHTREQRAELLRRQPDGGWPTDPTQIAEGDLILESIGFSAPLAALYRTAPGGA